MKIEFEFPEGVDEVKISTTTYSEKDGISIRLIKYLPHTMCTHQSILINEMIEDGHLDYAIKLSNEKLQKLVNEEKELINRLNNDK